MLEEYNEYNCGREVKRRASVMDLSEGILSEHLYKAYAGRYICSICFDCAHSAASVEDQCSWDASLILPKGAKYYIKLQAEEDHEAIPVIVECPQFKRQRRAVVDALDWDRR